MEKGEIHFLRLIFALSLSLFCDASHRNNHTHTCTPPHTLALFPLSFLTLMVPSMTPATNWVKTSRVISSDSGWNFLISRACSSTTRTSGTWYSPGNRKKQQKKTHWILTRHTDMSLFVLSDPASRQPPPRMGWVAWCTGMQQCHSRGRERDHTSYSQTWHPSVAYSTLSA